MSPGSPTLSVATSVTPSTYGGSVTFTATISSGPTGTVTFYDGGTSIGTGTISGTTAKYTTTTLTAGTHTITAGWAGNADYNSVSSGSITQTVNQATPAITWKTPAAITYGTALSATQLDATANTAGAFVYSPLSGTVLTAGSKTLSVTFTPTDTTDYTTATTTVTQSVSKAPLTVVVNSATGTYGSALPAFTGSVSGLVNGDTNPGTVTLSLSTTASSSSPYSDAGGYPITATMGGSAAG